MSDNQSNFNKQVLLTNESKHYGHETYKKYSILHTVAYFQRFYLFRAFTNFTSELLSTATFQRVSNRPIEQFPHFHELAKNRGINRQRL